MLAGVLAPWRRVDRDGSRRIEVVRGDAACGSVDVPDAVRVGVGVVGFAGGVCESFAEPFADGVGWRQEGGPVNVGRFVGECGCWSSTSVAEGGAARAVARFAARAEVRQVVGAAVDAGHEVVDGVGVAAAVDAHAAEGGEHLAASSSPCSGAASRAQHVVRVGAS